MQRLIELFLAILLPPVAVYLKVGISRHLWLNFALCLFFWLPGIMHALWLLFAGRRGG